MAEKIQPGDEHDHQPILYGLITSMGGEPGDAASPWQRGAHGEGLFGARFASEAVDRHPTRIMKLRCEKSTVIAIGDIALGLSAVDAGQRFFHARGIILDCRADPGLFRRCD